MISWAYFSDIQVFYLSKITAPRLVTYMSIDIQLSEKPTQQGHVIDDLACKQQVHSRLSITVYSLKID